MASFRLRRAGPEDAALLSHLKIATFKASYRNILPDDLLDGLDADNPFVGIGAWRRKLLDGDEEVFVVEAGAPVGFLVLAGAGPRDAPARGLLEQLYLLPGWQGLGWGRELWQFAAQRLAATERVPFAIGVLQGNSRARHLYERLGARQIDLRHDFDWRGTPIHEVLYIVDADDAVQPLRRTIR